MGIKENIVAYLDKLAERSVLKNVYIIEYNGKRLVMDSNKSSWKTLGAAKNAIRYDIPSFYRECPDTYRDRLEIIKELEDKEIIKYIKLI